MFGLAWYYLLAAMMNAAAAAYVSYGEMVSEGASRVGLAPKTRRLPAWLIGAFLGLYGLAVLMILGRRPPARRRRRRLRPLRAANALLAVMAGADAAHFAEVKEHGHGEGDPLEPPSLDDHHPAVGHRQADQSHALDLDLGRGGRDLSGDGRHLLAQRQRQSGQSDLLPVTGILMPQFMRDAIDFVAGPTTFFVGATLGFIAMIRWRRFIANGLVGWAIVNLFLLFFGLSMTDFDFRDIVTKPDNVPIVGLLILVGYFFWYALRRAVINDARIAQGLPSLEELEPDKTLTWPDLVYTELICMVILTIVLVVWGIVLQAPLEQPASSTVAPNPSKAPWYFLGLQEMLVYFDPWMAGVVLPSMIIVGLMAIPYIDTNKAGNGYFSYSDRKFAFLTFQYGFVVLWVVLILLGTFLRGPELELLRSLRVLGPAQGDPAQQRESLGHFLDPAPGDGQAAADPAARGAGDLADPGLLHDRALSALSVLLQEIHRAGGHGAVPHAGGPDPVHGQFAAQDGVALDDQPEIRGGHTRVLLQHLVTRSISQDE